MVFERIVTVWKKSGMEYKKSAAQIKTFLSGLIPRVTLLVMAGVLLSGVVLYLVSYTPLGASYGEVIASLEVYKAEIIKKTIVVYSIFSALVLLVVIALGVSYSHRISGPLYRIKDAAEEISDGNLDIDLKLREEDVMHTLAECVNRLAMSYREKDTRLNSDLEVIKRTLQALTDSIKDGDEASAKDAVMALESISERIEKTLSEIRI
jgi:methyl-accepting chemotaxis protein